MPASVYIKFSAVSIASFFAATSIKSVIL